MTQDLDASFHSRRSHVVATGGIVSTSQALAAQTGLAALREGGNAADAAVAAAAMLAVVEPVSCGLGGDAFALFFEGSTGRITSLNGSGRAPAAVSADEMRRGGRTRMPVFSGAAVTVPGTVAAWCDLLERHGTMDLARLLAPAIDAAERGYGCTEWIAHHWEKQVRKLRREAPWHEGDPDPGPPQPSGSELLPGGRAPRFGERVRLPEMARSLRLVAEGGREAFYRGDLARRIAAHAQAYGGRLAEEDLAAHVSTWDEPISARYRDVDLWECPPNGQGLAALVAARLLDGFEIADLDEGARTHLAIEAMRRGRADAARHVADPACVDVPVETLLGEADLAPRRRGIDPDRATPRVEPGAMRTGSDTVYLAVVDGAGNACSFIQSLYMGMGTGLVVPGAGFSLHNRGALFSLQEDHPNELAPGRRPLHTILPALTTRDGVLESCFGVMGGGMQPQGHLQVLVRRFDERRAPQPTLDAPRWRLESPADGPDRLLLEEGFDEETIRDLVRRGHAVERVTGPERATFGRGQIILRDPDSGVLVAASDPRADGAAAGF